MHIKRQTALQADFLGSCFIAFGRGGSGGAVVTASRGLQFLEELWRNPASPHFHRKRSWAGPSPKQAVCGGAAASLVGVRLPCCLLHKSELPQPLGRDSCLGFGCVYLGVWALLSPGLFGGLPVPLPCLLGPYLPHTRVRGLSAVCVGGEGGASWRRTVPPPQPAGLSGLKV